MAARNQIRRYRMHARLDRGAVRLLTRTGLDWTHKYPAIAAAVALLPAREAYLDGELCGVRPDGITSFSLIQNASDTSNGDALVFFLVVIWVVVADDEVFVRSWRGAKRAFGTGTSRRAGPPRFSLPAAGWRC
jgi:hypothetical protein